MSKHFKIINLINLCFPNMPFYNYYFAKKKKLKLSKINVKTRVETN